MFSVGHIVWDVTRMFFYDTDWAPIDKQMVFHHFISGFGITGPLLSGYGAPGIATMLLLTENSSVFLVTRNLIPKSRKESCAFKFNTIFFFLVFSFFRIMLMPPIIIVCIQEMIAITPIIGWRILFTALPSILAVALYGLNWFWYFKILRVVFAGAKVTEDKSNSPDEVANGEGDNEGGTEMIIMSKSKAG